MDYKTIICRFWAVVTSQNEAELPQYFNENAVICWHNTNEQFTTEEYVVANCKYPGDWKPAKIERFEQMGSTVVTATRIETQGNQLSFYASSFFQFEKDKIVRLDEYWGDNGAPPQWRKEMKLGQSIL